jgi:hypothetical protein
MVRVLELVLEYKAGDEVSTLSTEGFSAELIVDDGTVAAG